MELCVGGHHGDDDSRFLWSDYRREVGSIQIEDVKEDIGED